MKKIFYSLLFVMVSALALSSCTEENVTPQEGGSGSGDPCQWGCK